MKETLVFEGHWIIGILQETENLDGTSTTEGRVNVLDPTREADNLKEAFDKSIEKWTAIEMLHAKGAHLVDNALSYTTCGLCDLYFRTVYLEEEDRIPGCSECPIMDYTGQGGCDDTPYETYNAEIDRALDEEVAPFVDPEVMRSIADDEIAFLQLIQERIIGS